MDRQSRYIIRNMEYLVKLLHKEWERSGKTKAEVIVGVNDVAAIESCMARIITEKQKQLENEELTFKQSMALSQNNFILLRLIKKVKKGEAEIVKKVLDFEFVIELDKEEYKLFKDIVGIQEG